MEAQGGRVSSSFLPSEALEEASGRRTREVRGTTGGISPGTPGPRQPGHSSPVPVAGATPAVPAVPWLKHTWAVGPGATCGCWAKRGSPAGKRLRSVHQKEPLGSWCAAVAAQAPGSGPVRLALAGVGLEGDQLA